MCNRKNFCTVICYCLVFKIVDNFEHRAKGWCLILLYIVQCKTKACCYPLIHALHNIKYIRNHQYIKVFNDLQAICTIFMYLCFLLHRNLDCTAQVKHHRLRCVKSLTHFCWRKKKKENFFVTSVSIGDKITRDSPSSFFKVLIAIAFYDFGSLINPNLIRVTAE